MTITKDTGPLIIDDSDRYSRFRLIGWWEQDKIAAARVLVVGAGALGNEVLKNLALLGVGNVFVIDYDDIEDSNLTRSVLFRQRHNGRKKADVAAEAVRDMNPDVKITPIIGNVLNELGLGFFASLDCVMGCLDNREARLWVNRCCWKVGTPWVDGGIQVISGVVRTYVPPNDACYECSMSEMDYKLINLKYSCPLLKREDLLQGKTPTAPTIASIVGGLQVQEMLKIIHDIPVNGGTGIMISGETNLFYNTTFQRREDCLSHDVYPEPEVLDVDNTISLAELFSLARETHEFSEGDSLILHLDRDLLKSVFCSPCNYSKDFYRPITEVSLEEGICPQCGEVCQTEVVNMIYERDGDLLKHSLSSLGIPPLDIVKVGSDDKMGFFLLAQSGSCELGLNIKS
jgi:adenylyltransferase/sulfurtransferase